MSETKLKWGLLAGIVVIGGWFVAPIITTIAWNLTSMLVALGALYAAWLLLPAFCEALAQVSYRLWEMSIRADPIARAQRDLEASATNIDTIESRISEANAQYKQAQGIFKQQRAQLSAEKAAEFEESLEALRQMGEGLVQLRDQAITEHQEFGRDVERAKVELSVGNAIAKASSTFSFAKKQGGRSSGARIALEESRCRFSQGQAQLALTLSREDFKLAKKEKAS